MKKLTRTSPYARILARYREAIKDIDSIENEEVSKSFCRVGIILGWPYHFQHANSFPLTPIMVPNH